MMEQWSRGGSPRNNLRIESGQSAGKDFSTEEHENHGIVWGSNHGAAKLFMSSGRCRMSGILGFKMNAL